VNKYRPKHFNPKWVFVCQFEPGDQNETSEKHRQGVQRSNTACVVDSDTAYGFAVDILSVKLDLSSSTTTRAVERSIRATYSTSVTDTYINNSDSMKKAYYQLVGTITYEDGLQIDYVTGFPGLSFYGMECKPVLPEQSASEAWDFLMGQ